MGRPIIITREPVEQRFWRRVNKSATNGCWLWTGAVYPNGYGHLGGVYEERDIRKPVSRYAHRLSYEFCVGKIPAGLQVLHRCDVRHCVNPKHLFVGTQKDNVQDAISKCRATVCSNNAMAKLTEADAIQIRKEYEAATIKRGVRAALSRVFRVSHITITRIIKRERWKYAEHFIGKSNPHQP